MAKPLVLGGVGVVAVLGLAVAALSLVPAAFDPEANLQKVAKKVAAGPKSGDDAEHIKAELESSTKDFLEKESKLSAADLTAKLQKIFPNSAFETRVFDLPRNLRLVEIDTMLQATDYLVSGKHVAVLRNFEVFETAKVVPDGVGSNITLLGHRNAQAGHRPQVRVFALLPDGVADRTQESVPPISGDGNAAFAPNGKDINLDLSLMSKAGEERLFTIETMSRSQLTDETVKSRLTLKDGKYELSEEQGRGPFAALRATAFVLTDPTAKGRFQRYFSDSTIGSVISVGKLKVNPPLFTIKKLAVANANGGASSAGDGSSRHSRHHGRHHRRHGEDDTDASGDKSAQSAATTEVANGPSGYTFLLNNAQDAFEVAMVKRDNRFLVTSLKRVKATNEGAEVVVESKPAEAAASAPVTAAAGTDAGKSNKALTNVDDFGTQKTVPVDNSSLSSKVVIKQASKESATEIAPDKGNKGSADKKEAASSDKVKIAVATPPVAPVKDTSKNGSSEQVEKTTAESGVITTNDSTPFIKLRRGASITYKSIGELKRGDAVKILGKKDDWYKVRVNGQTGFVFSQFVSTGKSSKAAPESEKPSSSETTAASSQGSSSSSSSVVIRRTRNLRDEQHHRIGLAEAGNRVVVLGTASNGKYKVRLSNGVIGYVDKEAFDGIPVRAIDDGSSSRSEERTAQSSEKSSSKSRESRHHKSHKSVEKPADSASDMPQMVP